MKRLLLPLLAALALPTAVNAENANLIDYKCLELGKKECVIKQIVIGSCTKMKARNEGLTDAESLSIGYAAYKEYGEQKGFFPTKDLRDSITGKTDKEREISSSLIDAYYHLICPNEFPKYAANSFINLRQRRIKQNKSPHTLTFDNHMKFFTLTEFSIFNQLISLLERNK